MASTYSYNKTGCSLSRLQELISEESAIITAYLGGTQGVDELELYFDGDLSPSEKSALDIIVAAHDGEPPMDASISRDQEYQRLLKKVEALERLIIKQTDGMIDDFVDDEGVDGTASSNIVVKPGYVRSNNLTTATLVTKTVETVSTRQQITVTKHMFEGDGEFFASADGGITWQQITTFGEPVALSGKKYKVKATLTGPEKLSLLAFEVE